jgi:hypothetical protein
MLGFNYLKFIYCTSFIHKPWHVKQTALTDYATFNLYILYASYYTESTHLMGPKYREDPPP